MLVIRISFPRSLGEYRVNHDPWAESLNNIGCFSISQGIQVVDDILEFLLIFIGLFQTLCYLLLVISVDIPQDRLCTVN